MLAPAHVSIIMYVSFDGIAAMGLTRCVSAGAKLPAHRLLTVCSLENSQDVSLFTQSMAVTNVDECLSPGSKHCNCTIAVASCGCGDAATGFPSA